VIAAASGAAVGPTPVANDPVDAPPLFTFMDGGGLREMSSEVIDALLRIAGDRDAGIFLVEARHAGGALARQSEDAIPFSFKSPWFVSALAAAPTPELLEGPKRSVAALLEAVEPALTALKDKYDPANVFRFNHNIAPSNGEAKARG
jgi:hypothetical protein